MKFIAIVFIALSLTACGIVDRAIGSVTGFSKVCVDGVSYLQFTSGASVQYDQAGKVVTCK
jgi:hypothetical protein